MSNEIPNVILSPTVTVRTRAENAEYVVQSIEGGGIRVPPSSRLQRMRKLFDSGPVTMGPNHPDFEVALESHRDLQLLAFSFDQLDGTPKSDAFKSILKRLVQDSALPQDDRTKSPGRDAGFEVYVGGVCAAHLSPVAWEEPDVTCFHEGRKYGLAAKRIKSLNKLDTRVQKAVEQIDNSGLPGLVVLDLAPAFNPNNLKIGQLNESTFWTEYQGQILIRSNNSLAGCRGDAIDLTAAPELLSMVRIITKSVPFGELAKAHFASTWASFLLL